MKIKVMIVGALIIMPFLARADVVVNLDALTQVNGTDFSSNYGGGIGTGANNTFNGTSATIANGATVASTTYGAPAVYAVTSKSEFTGNFGVSDNGGSGWRIRLNSNVTDSGRFYSDNLFAVNNVSFDAANDTLNAGEIFISDAAAVSSAQVRFVVRAGGNFYISEASSNFQTGALDGNLNTSYSIEALSASWFSYDPTSNPTASGVADIGASVDPATFGAIDFIGFHLEATSAANGTIAAHNGSNFGVREFSATAIPEPATLGMLGIFGGGILFIRRRFMI